MPSFWDQLFGRAKQEPTPAPDTVFSLDMDLLRQTQTNDWIAAIDFGTTYSKAALARSGTGNFAQDDARILALDWQLNFIASALFIHNDAIHFGRRAFELSNDLNDETRSRFESPKHYFREVNQEELDHLSDTATNPTTTPFKNGDLLALLLGFIVHRFHLGLQQIPELNGRLPKLRISRPAWSPEQESAGEELLRRYLGQGFILAGLLNNAFDNLDGLDVTKARDALDRAYNHTDNPGNLFDRLLAKSDTPTDCIQRGFVPESTAVAAAHVGVNQRRVFVVADIGGGTSDFGVFLSVPGANQRGRIGEIESARKSLPKGGDDIDRLLLKYLARKNDLEADLPVNRAAKARLARTIRDRKEELFREQQLVGEFEGDLAEFLAQDEVVDLASKISSTFQVPFDRALEYKSPDRRLLVIRTGGGSKIPFVARLGGDSEALDYPSWITDPNWQVLYPQLAVAIGAAMPVMPEQR
jgi:hypothetical protein